MKLPHEKFCVLPWISLEASPIGTVRPCCLAEEEIEDDQGRKFHLGSATFGQIQQSQHMRELRSEFLAGQQPETCRKCWDEEHSGRRSKRMHTLDRLKHMLPDQIWTQDAKPLMFLDLKLGNICNLKCRICGSWSSSKWAEEEMNYLPKDANKKEHIAYTWLKQGAWPRKTTTFWDNMRELIPNIKYFEFTGGEPWMIQEHFDLLQYAVDKGYSKNIDIHYNTNASVVPDGIHRWAQFGRVDIAFSIDNVGKRFEYERYGAKWDEANEIIDGVHFAKAVDTPNITTQLCFTINIQNVYYIDELLAWADTKDFNSIYFNMLHSPDHMSIQYMTPAAQELVLNKLKTTFWISDRYQREIDSIINFIEAGPGSDGTEFLFKMRRTDKHRDQNFVDTHPETARAMGYE